MSTIIAGGFENITGAEAAKARLQSAGVNAEYICDFRVNPPGMHDRTPIGGDRDESPGAHKAGGAATRGAAIGAAAGVVAGIAATPLLGPAGIAAGAGVGGYTGSLVGGMKGGIDQEAQPDHTVVRPAEAMVAVNADAAGIAAEDIVRIFEECGAWQVERATGRWEDGEWADFDAALPPHLVGGRAPNAGADPRTSRH